MNEPQKEINSLLEILKDNFPNAEITMDNPDDSIHGLYFIDIKIDEDLHTVSFQNQIGFGVFEKAEFSLFDKPSEIFTNPQSVIDFIKKDNFQPKI